MEESRHLGQQNWWGNHKIKCMSQPKIAEITATSSKQEYEGLQTMNAESSYPTAGKRINELIAYYPITQFTMMHSPIGKVKNLLWSRIIVSHNSFCTTIPTVVHRSSMLPRYYFSQLAMMNRHCPWHHDIIQHPARCPSMSLENYLQRSGILAHALNSWLIYITG